MIGAYVHHHGRGHLHRVLGVLARLDDEATVLTSLDVDPSALPANVEVIALPDDLPPPGVTPIRPTAGGVLHWAPLGVPGLATRTARLVDWIDRAAPRAFWVDVSVEMVLAARLAGAPVVTTLMPGVRQDRPHRLAFDVAEALMAAWPSGTRPDAVAATGRVVHEVGGLSRYEHRERIVAPDRPSRPTVVHLSGAGGEEDGRFWRAVRQLVPRAEWISLGGMDGRWVDDPWPILCAADVVLTGAGQGAIADCACLDTEIVVVPQERPFAEQQATAHALQGMPGVTVCGLRQGPAAVAAAIEGALGRSREGGVSGFRAAWQVDGAADRAVAVLREPLRPDGHR